MTREQLLIMKTVMHNFLGNIQAKGLEFGYLKNQAWVAKKEAAILRIDTLFDDLIRIAPEDNRVPFDDVYRAIGTLYGNNQKDFRQNIFGVTPAIPEAVEAILIYIAEKAKIDYADSSDLYLLNRLLALINNNRGTNGNIPIIIKNLDELARVHKNSGATTVNSNSGLLEVGIYARDAASSGNNSLHTDQQVSQFGPNNQ